MKKIDWYILKKFLTTFLFCLLIFTVIAVAVDSSEKADEFVKVDFSTWEFITNYYIGFVPFIWSLLFPLFVFLAVIFFTSRMASRSEIIAILSSGTSYNRFLRPYLVGGLLFASILWFGSRYWIPKANIIRTDFQREYVDTRNPVNYSGAGFCEQCFYRRLDSVTYLGLRRYDPVSRSANGFFMERIRNNKVYYNLRAELIRWDTVGKQWKLFNVAERKIDSMRESMSYYDTLVMNISIKPEELVKDKYLQDKLTSPELAAFIRREEARGSEGLNTLKVEQHRRTATPATVILLTIIGVVVASRKIRGGSGIHLAIGIVIAALFIISDRFSSTFAIKSNLPPLLAAWLPNIVFSGVAFWLYRRTPK